MSLRVARDEFFIRGNKCMYQLVLLVGLVLRKRGTPESIHMIIDYIGFRCNIIADTFLGIYVWQPLSVLLHSMPFVRYLTGGILGEPGVGDIVSVREGLMILRNHANGSTRLGFVRYRGDEIWCWNISYGRGRLTSRNDTPYACLVFSTPLLKPYRGEAFKIDSVTCMSLHAVVIDRHTCHYIPTLWDEWNLVIPPNDLPLYIRDVRMM
tara:strand:+ start:447 stop:1073 length:627 start_codon:yes stop_codon:yes gene_type:complete